jgi:hypothetical protein
MSDHGLQLDKYYFDCVTDAGDALIAYSAGLRWRGIRLGYSAILASPYRGEATYAASMRRGPPPQTDAAGIAWRHTGLGVEGRWNVAGPAIRRELLNDDDGSIVWNCLCDGAAASVTCGGGHFTGTGYVEHLLLTIPPWRLPFDLLRWGRFICHSDRLVWIQWRGRRNLDLLYHNGREVCAETIDDQGVSGRDGALEWSESRVLRDDELLGSLAKPLRPIAGLFPRSILKTHETKWLSRGTLRTAGRTGDGQAIHERVDFRGTGV